MRGAKTTTQFVDRMPGPKASWSGHRERPAEQTDKVNANDLLRVDIIGRVLILSLFESAPSDARAILAQMADNQ
ncbi:hypothetical protein K788_00011740 [Paraburkholderia caribensis MBA4]|uniref:Uncharacterized protein n=1 Tax=Paraburkholderia caribensis MBA4 TaxID=1323664 RepID=A0A0P0R8W1_9BURK|nr:hypothetical protein [Paraburkholderia caribensis]ALL64724.1 hypothetical protein K788_00011740 [Paraburkholderia caribensis MBA4]